MRELVIAYLAYGESKEFLKKLNEKTDEELLDMYFLEREYQINAD